MGVVSVVGVASVAGVVGVMGIGHDTCLSKYLDWILLVSPLYL